MRLDLTSLTREDIAFWNARWSAGSTSNTQELHQDLQFCMQEQMDSKLDINTKRLGHWLCKNGWTPTRGLGNKRQWKKKQLCTLTKSDQVGDSNEATTHKKDQALARHKPWYIDLRNESLHFSKLEVLKTVIFIDREDTEPSVYWDFGRFIKTLNADNAKANMSVWWQTHRPWYEKIRIEFDLHPLSLLPCRRSLARKPGIINKADVTDETLMTAKALVAMLLHWSTNASMTRTRRAAAKAMLNDILNLALSAKYDSDEKTWHFIARNMMEETQKIQLTVTPASMKRKSEKNNCGTSTVRIDCEQIHIFVLQQTQVPIRARLPRQAFEHAGKRIERSYLERQGRAMVLHGQRSVENIGRTGSESHNAEDRSRRTFFTVGKVNIDFITRDNERQPEEHFTYETLGRCLPDSI